MTSQDLKQIGGLIDKKFDKRFDEQDKKFDKRLNERFDKQNKLIINFVKDQLIIHDENLESKLSKWKSEVIDAVDALASEMKDSQDFRLITTNQIAENWERTDRLEKKVFGAVMTA